SGVAAPDPRHRPRDEQLAGAHQVHRRQPRDDRRTRAAPSDWRDDVQRGLGVIASRSESLSRFMSAYARLAKLPPPKMAPLDVAGVVDRVVTLEKGHNIQVVPGPKLAIQGDGDQLEQLLINLVRNAMDAVRETGGAVRV